jgi:hypothetical protein
MRALMMGEKHIMHIKTPRVVSKTQCPIPRRAGSRRGKERKIKEGLPMAYTTQITGPHKQKTAAPLTIYY